jgi:hypothetical protein
VARKKRRKRSWLGTLLFLVSIPLVVWFLAFLIWFYWNDISGHVGRQDKTPPTKASKQMDKPSDKTAQERIGDEDRRKLEDILKSKK